MDSLAYIHLVEAYDRPLEPAPLLDFKRPKFNGKTLVSGISVALVASFLGVAAPARAFLKVGKSGPEVMRVQQRLGELGYFKGPSTGYYGKITRKAVKDFQRNNNLKDDGIVGPQTQVALQEVYPKAAEADTQPIVKIGRNGPTVYRVQRQLSSLRYYDYRKMDGIFDEETKQAVIDFQQANDLKADGIVGSKTHEALANQTGL